MAMKNFIVSLVALATFVSVCNHQGNAKDKADQLYPIGKPGSKRIYFSRANDLPESVVRKMELTLGAIEEKNGKPVQWLQLNAVKENKQAFSIWMLSSSYPSASEERAQKEIFRYVLDEAVSQPIEFINQSTRGSVLPNTGAWKHLLPRVENGKNPFNSKAEKVRYLGSEYILESKTKSAISPPPEGTIAIKLTPDLLIGVPHNAKVKDETRRYDESDYDYVPLIRENYMEMIDHGMNVFNVNAEQVKWIENKNIYYWGIGGEDIHYPEDLYRSNYLGPAIFFDEPMVHTRDQALRPKFKEDPTLRVTVTPQMFFEEFKHEYHKAKYERSPTQLLKGLAKRKDVDVGDMEFLQQNVYSWETMVSSALYQLSEGDQSTPAAMVFEPPGRFGAKRVLPELNMSFDCQIPVDDPKNLIGMIKGFLRGAARVTGKDWGISIYGQVVPSEALWYLTHAYDQGASQFYYWDSYQLAAVPYKEYLNLSRGLRQHANNFPKRDMDKLKHAAEVAILLPVGYNLGHVKMGIGNISGLPELNMERANHHGVKYREVMNNFYIEIERCIRLGVEYDLFWNMENLELERYREVVHIMEDGKVEISKSGDSKMLNSARVPERPDGDAPQLSVELELENGHKPGGVIARATVKEGSSPIYYTQGADKKGVYHNQYVLWEMYGPQEEDYTDFWYNRWEAVISEEEDSATSEIKFKIDKSGKYRLRVSTVDVAGRSKAVWKDIIIE